MRWRFLFTFWLLAIAIVSVTEAAGKRYALIVGVKKYRTNQPLPELSYTENDANELASVLKAGDYDVTLMTQAVGRGEGKEVLAPHANYIRDQIDAIVKSPFLTSEDLVVVALTGHGVQFELIEGNKKSSKFYFCPADADVAQLKTANEIADRNQLLDLDELYSALSMCKAGGKLLFVDACRNDPSKPAIARTVTSTTLPPLPPPPGGIAAFFSCSAHEQAIEDRDLKHGVFFHHIIEGLRGEADAGNAQYPMDGEITLPELSGYTGRGTYDFVRSKYQGYKQTPELRGEYRGMFPLLTVKQRFAESQGIQLVSIPSGEFMMGTSDADLKVLQTLYPNANKGSFLNEQPQHSVRITKLAALSAHEITIGQFRKFVEDSNYRTEAERDGKGGSGWNEVKGKFEMGSPEYSWKYLGFPQSDAHPVSNVSWNDAVAYCQWLTKKDGRAFRLPSEAEWEYCARAGSTGLFAEAKDREQLVLIGNVGDLELKSKPSKNSPRDFESGSDEYTFTAPVGHYRANRFGLYDMVGNVCEWCMDEYEPNYNRRIAPTEPTRVSKSSERVIRGGGWGYDGAYCRPAFRNSASIPYNLLLGFRVAQGR